MQLLTVLAGPLILETFLKHYLDPRRYKEEKKAPDARVDFMYDEGEQYCVDTCRLL